MALWRSYWLTLKLKILCNDTYGKAFFKLLTNRLKEEDYISNFHISVAKFYGLCNPKLDRQMRAFSCLRKYNYFIVIVDADGKPPLEIREKIECHFPKDIDTVNRVVVLENEIEDWICASEDIRLRDRKPSVILHHQRGYEKYRLPDYASRLDIERLREECASFQSFLQFLETTRDQNACA